MALYPHAIHCTNCGASGVQMIGWLYRYCRKHFQRKGEEWELAPDCPTCCEPPFEPGRTEVPLEELNYRALPRGEDR